VTVRRRTGVGSKVKRLKVKKYAAVETQAASSRCGPAEVCCWMFK
jgi:hypothetical protein